MVEPKRCYLVPPGERRCIWMDAGVLPYQLCTQPEGCDDCGVDDAMRWRMHSPWFAGGGVRAHNTLRVAKSLLEGLRYCRNHFWVRRMNPRLVRLGLEPGLVEVLMNVKGIVFPSLQLEMRKGQACAWAVMDAGTLPLETPLDGVLAAVNKHLIAMPHMLALRPFHDGWICELEVRDADAEIAELMTAGEASSKYASEQQRFAGLLNETTRSKRSSPVSGPNGETFSLKSSVLRLDPARYLDIVRQCFGWTGYHLK
jgi:glycine cleavage system H protein